MNIRGGEMAPLQVSAAGGGLASIDDVALAVMMLQLEGMDADIAGRIKKMQALNEVRKAYGDRIAEYRKITMGKTGKEALDVPEELRHRVDYAPDNETGRSVTVESEEFIDNDGDGRAWASTIQAEMDRLQGELDKLGGDAEIEMMLINRAVKQRESVLSFTTNVLSSSHQARMAIIGNIGK